MPVISWSSIELLHNVVRTLSLLEQATGEPLPRLRYRSKVKLHGTNCAVQAHGDSVTCQGRTTILTPAADNRGFAAWVEQHRGYFCALPAGTVLFGEWCGPGVERGMAVSRLPRKVFAIFASQRDGRLCVEPDELEALLPREGRPEDLHVLPWEQDEIELDYRSPQSLEAAAERLNARVAEVEAQDPWVMRTFGLSGLGEGLVLYPVGEVPADPERYARWMFKAKGEKHRTVATHKAVAVRPEAQASVDAFVRHVLTEARLQQGLAEACAGARDPRQTGAFLAWIAADVQKETVAELEASALTWAAVEKAVRARARAWFLQKG
jgi:hypothetical protein